MKFWKNTGMIDLEWLTRLFNIIFRTTKMLEEWRWSTVILLYKNKGDIQKCNNYRVIKLLSHIMKVWERLVEVRVKRSVFIYDLREPVRIHVETLEYRNHSPCKEIGGAV